LTPSKLYEILNNHKQIQKEVPDSYVMCKTPPGIPFNEQKFVMGDKELVLVNLDFEWQGFHIRDSFTWPSFIKDPEEMKAFAMKTLDDLLGKDLNNRQPEDIEWFCVKVACEISKEIKVAEYFKNNPGIAGTKDNTKISHEHIIRLHLDYKDSFVRIKDEFDWDLSNHLNQYLLRN
jgi:hypothetical protein